MSHEAYAENGKTGLAVMVLSGIFSAITFANAQAALTMVGTIVGIIAACVTIRYYWLAGNRVKNQKP